MLSHSPSTFTSATTSVPAAWKCKNVREPQWNVPTVLCAVSSGFERSVASISSYGMSSSGRALRMRSDDFVTMLLYKRLFVYDTAMSRTRTISDDSMLDVALGIVRSSGPETLTFAALSTGVGLAASTIVQRFGTEARVRGSAP